MEDTRNVAPWHERAVELEPIKGPYCVYAAWCEWFSDYNEQQSESMQLDLDGLDKTALYAAFEAACHATVVIDQRGTTGEPLNHLREPLVF